MSALLCATLAHAQPVLRDANIAAQNRPVENSANASSTVELPSGPGEEARAALPFELQVSSIRVEGAESFPPETVRAILASFEGQRLGRDDLQELLTAVSGLARAEGYVFARSSAPAQQLVDGTLVIRLDLGQVDEVRITGTRNPAIDAVLAPLVGRAPRKAELERQLMLLGDLPGVSVGNSRYAIENGRGILIVPVSQKAMSARAALDNRGLSALGPVRMQLGIDFNGLFGGDDQLSIDGVVTPAQPRELAAVFGRYSRQITASGTTVALTASYARTRLGEPYRAYDAQGESASVSASISQPLLRSRRSSVWVGATLKQSLINQFWEDERVVRDRITTAGVDVSGYWPLAGGRLRAGIGLTQGLSFLGGTRQGDPLASRLGAGSDFTKIGFWSNWQGGLFGPLSARLAIEGQWSADPLPSGEQIAIGGPAFGRAYEFGERSGDRGFLASLELRGALYSSQIGPLRYVQLYGFADAGDVSSVNNSFGSGSLHSFGPGARIGLWDSMELQLEAAFPFDEVRSQSGDQSPRLSFGLRMRQ